MSKEPGKCPFPGCERPIAPGGHRCAECTSSYHSDEETVDAQEEEIRRLRDAMTMDERMANELRIACYGRYETIEWFQLPEVNKQNWLNVLAKARELPL